MARERAIQIRVSHEEYDSIKENAGEESVSAYVRRLAVSDGSDYGPSFDGPDPRLAYDPPPDESLTKPENRAKATEQIERIEADSRETAEASLQPLITQLKGQGMTTPVATREARKRLGL